MSSKTLCFTLAFGLLALLLLPVTGLWALIAYLAGDGAPLFTLRGKNVEDPIDESETV